METFEENTLTVSEVPSRRERLKAIFKIMSESPPAKDAVEANALLMQAFDKVERLVDSREAMEVYSFDRERKITCNNKEVYYQIYNKHVLFIDEYGAIDIRLVNEKMPVTEELLKKHPSFPEKEMKLAFEKPSANGHKVWD